MAEILVKAGDQSPHPAHFKDGDVVTIQDDKHQWGRCESLDVWLSEGLKEEDWPGGFNIIRIPGTPKEDYLYLLEEGPIRVRGLPDYTSLPKDGNVLVAVAADVTALSTDRVVAVAETTTTAEVLKP
jgi:hypothetical protein